MRSASTRLSTMATGTVARSIISPPLSPPTARWRLPRSWSHLGGPSRPRDTVPIVTTRFAQPKVNRLAESQRAALHVLTAPAAGGRARSARRGEEGDHDRRRYTIQRRRRSGRRTAALAGLWRDMGGRGQILDP